MFHGGAERPIWGAKLLNHACRLPPPLTPTFILHTEPAKIHYHVKLHLTSSFHAKKIFLSKKYKNSSGGQWLTLNVTET